MRSIDVADAVCYRAAKLISHLLAGILWLLMSGKKLTAPASVAEARIKATLLNFSFHPTKPHQYPNHLPHASLIMSIPKGQIVNQSRKETCLKRAQ